MSDFSLFSLFTAGLACMVPFASAYTQPVGDNPVGNPIALPGLNSVVPVSQPYTITWNPTTPGTVTLLLLKGPATNLALENVIVEMTPNNGKYVWTPPSSLQPTDNAKGYGIQLIVDNGDAKGQYQYTTQFGISNPGYHAGGSSSPSSSSSSDMSAPAYLGSSKQHLSAPTYEFPSTAENANVSTLTTSVYAHPTTAPTAPAAVNGSAAPPAPYYPKTQTVAGAASPTGAMGPSYGGNGTGVEMSTGGAGSVTTSALGLVLAAGVAVMAC